MLQLTLHPVELPLRHAWTIAHGTRTVQRNLIVALHDTESGHTGYGEAPGIPYMGVTVEAVSDWLTPNEQRIDVGDGEGKPSWWNVGEERWDEMVHVAWQSVTAGDGSTFVFPNQKPVEASFRFAFCAFDQAMHDLWGKIQRKAVLQLWGIHREHCPASNYTLGMAPPEELVTKLQEFPDFPVYKIKLGTPPERGGLQQDLAIVEHLRKHTHAAFRVDANTAWTAEQTIRLAGLLRDLGVEFIEQPLPPDAPRKEHEAAYFGSDLPIIADESCQTEDDVEKCAGLFHGINIKLSKCGGMTPARRMIVRARELGLKVMMGCMTETTVGISAIGQLLPLLDYVDMDGALLLAPGADPADGVKVGPDGVAVFPEGAAGYGNGVTLTRELPAV